MSQRWRKYPPEFRQEALRQMRDCGNISELARKLGIRRKWLYEWKKQATADKGGGGGGEAAEREPGAVRRLRKQVRELESLVCRQQADLDFFKGALQLVEERRRKRELTTGQPCTSESGRARSCKAQ